MAPVFHPSSPDGAPTCFDDLIYEVAGGNLCSAVTSCSGQRKVSRHSLEGVVTGGDPSPTGFISAYANSTLQAPALILSQ